MGNIKKYLILSLSAVLLWQHSTYAQSREELESLTGTAIILMERSTGRVLYERNPDQLIYPASMIKVMTALLLLTHFQPDDIVRVGREIYYVPVGSSIADHWFGDHVSVEVLLHALLLPSGNDSANVAAANVARVVSGQDMPFPEAEAFFTGLMNDKARSLGATRTNFTNAHGFHDEAMQTTVRDLALIADYATRNPDIYRVAQVVSWSGPSAPGEGLQTREFSWLNTNHMIRPGGEFHHPNVTGLKTGFHTPAGWCFIGTGMRDGMEVITVIAGSYASERWVDTAELMNYAFHTYAMETVHEGQGVVETIAIYNPRWGDESEIETIGTQDFAYLLSQAELDRIQRTIHWDEALLAESEELAFVAPFTAGAILGQVVYTLDGRELFRDQVVLNEDVLEWSYGASMIYVINSLRENPFSIMGLSFMLGGIFLLMALYKITAVIIHLSNRKTKKRGYPQPPKMKRW